MNEGGGDIVMCLHIPFGIVRFIKKFQVEKERLELSKKEFPNRVDY